ncbi:gene transfer agent family protein [Phyllobacterium bourgognense]|uniref:Tail tube GTA-gp10-like protein n=1 Tax=Phyllobacterium bourgognense TaxID=314236 RepID=A0A368YMV0_9HYPH|nr:gene transfer agent family protein [Phyllobacterium bourgognense]RCW80929.1 tail tube GTA-gp10-like protein [Phyllobacterium bourgognense]
MPDNHHYARITQPFGDGNYDFQFGWKAAIEWEEKFNRSLFGTFNRMHREGIYLIADIKEIIRLALIGAGTAPVAALKLVERYVEGRPLSENMTLSLQILEAAFFGNNAPAPAPTDG